MRFSQAEEDFCSHAFVEGREGFGLQGDGRWKMWFLVRRLEGEKVRSDDGLQDYRITGLG